LSDTLRPLQAKRSGDCACNGFGYIATTPELKFSVRTRHGPFLIDMCGPTFGSIFVANLPATQFTVPVGRMTTSILGNQPCKSHTLRATSETASMKRHIEVTTIWTTFCRCLKRVPGLERINRALNIRTTFSFCLRRMPGFEGLWLNYPTSSSSASLIKGNATHDAGQDGHQVSGRATSQIAVW
jgi:hypothetical protein